VTIGALPNYVLLDIFDFCCQETQLYEIGEGEWLEDPKVAPPVWYPLVHVYQRWWHVVLASPIHLKLVLLCTERTPVTQMLHLWPPLPIVIWAHSSDAMDNIISALEHHDHYKKLTNGSIRHSVAGSISCTDTSYPLSCLMRLCPALLDMFLAGSTPRPPHLQTLHLDGISFLTLPKLLLTTPDLISLTLWGIPHTGYSPVCIHQA
jgi:hypothetical protein